MLVDLSKFIKMLRSYNREEMRDTYTNLTSVLDKSVLRSKLD